MKKPLGDIPVTVETGDSEGYTSTQASEQVKALLREMQNMLQILVKSGEHNYIDIRSLPLSSGELDSLKEILGTGEVEATVNALGPTLIRETQIPGIWWVTHKNAHEEVLSEYIEVTTLPEILVTQHHDLHESPGLLQHRLEQIDVS